MAKDKKNYELAEIDYMLGMKYKDIAKKYGVSINTVKSWKQRYAWKRDGVHTKNRKSVHTKKGTEEEVKTIMENEELTDKQKLFCIYYTKYFNATKAYKKAYKCSYNTAMVEGSRHLRNPKIKEEIKRLKASKLKGILLEEEDLLQKYIDIAFADINDYVKFGQEKVVLKDKDGNPLIDEKGEPITILSNYVNFKDSDEVDGTIISEVSKGKDGVKIKLQDKMKALDFLANNIGLLSIQDKAKVESEKVKIEKLKAEVNKIREGKDEKSIRVTIVDDIEGEEDED